MNIFESMAHALIGEHGRKLFRRDLLNLHTYGFENVFWKVALLCYGKDFYSLPARIGLTVKDPNAKDANSKFAFPAFTVEGSMHLGIPLPELLLYPTMGKFDTRYTPIHLGTGLLMFGGSFEDADELLQIEYMKKLWPEGRKPAEFVSQTTINPFGPADVGRKIYNIELLRNGSSFYWLDELGSALWFPTEYIKQATYTVSAALWFHSIQALANLDSRFAELRTKAAMYQLRSVTTGKHHTYADLAKYIRHVSKEEAASYIRGCGGGVSGVAACFRADADAATMAAGLRILAASKSGTLNTAYRYIGRALTYEDFKPLAAQHVLTLLQSVNFNLVKDVIATRSEELSSLLFKIPPNRMKDVMNCMSPEGRDELVGGKWVPTKWYPDTPQGNERLINNTEAERDYKAEWTARMQPSISKYLVSRVWRKRLLDIAEPDVAFLATLHAAATDNDPVPKNAIMNVLLSHPNAGGILEHMKECPVLFSEGYSRL